jgi:hypothetical protein
MTELELPPWTPPEPRELPEWRAQMIEETRDPMALQLMSMAINAGRTNILPTIPGMDASLGAVGAQILYRQEAQRLEEAALYYATADMTSLALAAAQTPPAEPMNPARLPSEAGFIVFAEPIGGYREDAAAALSQTMVGRHGASAMVTTPIVAASWGTWDPGSIILEGGGPNARVLWHWRTPSGQVAQLPDTYSGVWVTFYSPHGLFNLLPPDTVIGSLRDGSAMTAGDISRAEREGTVRHRPALQWDNEIIMATGARFAEPEPDTTDQWMHVLYTAWQLMGQTGKNALTEVEELPRERAGRKRDTRAAITGPSAVRILHVHSAHRPDRQAAAEDAAHSSGRRAPQWSCRWPVRPHRRDHCMNPRAHAEGECTHEDRIIPPYIKGPADKPLRVTETVNVWDRQPE